MAAKRKPDQSAFASLDQVRGVKLKLLELELAEKAGKLVPIADHNAEVAELCHMFVDATAQILNAVSALTRDPVLLKRVKEVIRNVRTALAERVEAHAREVNEKEQVNQTGETR